jgi:hypothetical protein
VLFTYLFGSSLSFPDWFFMIFSFWWGWSVKIFHEGGGEKCVGDKSINAKWVSQFEHERAKKEKRSSHQNSGRK